MHASNYGRGTVLKTIVDSPVYDSKNYCNVPYVDSAAVWNEETGDITIFAVNKSFDEDIEFSCDLRQFGNISVNEHIVVAHDDLKAVNTEAEPYNVKPVYSDKDKCDGGICTMILSKQSWNVIKISRNH